MTSEPIRSDGGFSLAERISRLSSREAIEITVSGVLRPAMWIEHEGGSGASLEERSSAHIALLRCLRDAEANSYSSDFRAVVRDIIADYETRAGLPESVIEENWREFAEVGGSQ